MGDKDVKDAAAKVKPSLIGYAKAWGESSVTPAIAATLIAAQHLRPPQFLPLLFPPVLMFSSYLNLNGHKIDAAGTSAAWSGLYILLARRRKQRFMNKWTVRGVVRGATIGVCAANLLAGGFTYAFGRRSKEANGDDGPPVS